MYRHIVLFRLHDGVSSEIVERAITALQELGTHQAGITAWHVAESLDSRKGRILIEDVSFSSEEAFREFRASPQHKRVAALMSTIADWWVGDYIT